MDNSQDIRLRHKGWFFFLERERESTPELVVMTLVTCVVKESHCCSADDEVTLPHQTTLEQSRIHARTMEAIPSNCPIIIDESANANERPFLFPDLRLVGK